MTFIKPNFQAGFLVIFIALVLGFSSCTRGTSTAPPTIAATIPGYLTPYWTATPSRTPRPPTLLVSIPTTPAPTATPFLHKLTDSDTMLGLAIRYGITLDELMAANPGVDPHYLTVGKFLVIPIKGATATVVPTPTPVPLILGEPRCYPTGEGGAWCTLLVRNEQTEAVEDLSVWIGLYSPEGKLLTSQTAMPPLNILPSGGAIPLMIYFQPMIPAQAIPRVELLTAIAVPPDDTRYITATVQLQNTNLDSSGLQATVKGQVVLPKDSPKAKVLWLVVVAYDKDGNAVGVRKWEADNPCEGLQPPGTPMQTPGVTTPGPTGGCGAVPFEVSVFSLGPGIERVEVLVEAR
jgi:LysM repeat protein